MHIKGTPKSMQQNPYYDNVVKEVFGFLKAQSQKAEQEGISNIIVDPGIGFGKRVQDNFELIKNLSEFKALNYPILIGLSRKSFLGKTLNLKIDVRDTATAILEGIALNNGARIIRTHNVKNGVQVCKLLNQIN
jgi:dihydropteroate synthase